MDGAQHDFKNIRTTGVADADGDKAFDEETFSSPESLPVSPTLPPSAVIQIMSRR
jgi:tRNA 2-thiocytidine biosynthesis protein TtcA